MRKMRLNERDLARFDGAAATTEKYLPYLQCRDYYNGTYSIASDHWQHDVPNKIHENDWIPMKLAAVVLGISKQALSDRIRRGTIPHETEKYTCIKMVRLMDCRKKKQAGRPKGKNSAGKVKEFQQTEITDYTTETICCTGSKTCLQEKTCSTCTLYSWIDDMCMKSMEGKKPNDTCTSWTND